MGLRTGERSKVRERLPVVVVNRSANYPLPLLHVECAASRVVGPVDQLLNELEGLLLFSGGGVTKLKFHAGGLVCS